MPKTERTRDHSDIKTQCTTKNFIRLLPSSSLLPRGETVFHLPLTDILKIFKDFPACKFVLAANHQHPENIQRLFRLQNCLSRESPVSREYSKTFWPASSIPAATSNHPASSIPAATSNHPANSIPAATSNHPATNSSNQQQQAAAINSSNQQPQPAEATSSSKQQQQPAFVLPAAPTRSTSASVSYPYGS